MKFNAKQYAKALFDALSETTPKDQNRVLHNFVQVVGKHGDLKLFEQISEEFHKLELKNRGETLAEVTTAHPLGTDEEKQLIKELNNYVNGEVELKKKIDSNLIGGVVVRLEDTVIDASVQKSLRDLKTNLEQ